MRWSLKNAAFACRALLTTGGSFASPGQLLGIERAPRDEIG